jgi:hypothetical protein
MIYTINGVPYDSSLILGDLQNSLLLPVCKDIMDKTACSLAVARDCYFRMIEDEGIIEKPAALEIRAYLNDELNDGSGECE